MSGGNARLIGAVLSALLCSLALANSAAAAPGTGDQPWKVGVSDDARATANSLFREANKLLKESRFKEAIAVYEDAISAWDHPAIHYNLALALMSLDSPIRAHEALRNALRFEGSALESDKLNEAKTHLKWTRKQLATVELSAKLEGTVLLLNGQEVNDSSGTALRLVRIGWNTVTARKAGYVEQTMNKMLGPGESWKFEADMYTPDDVTRYRRNWAWWKPWAVVGGGTALVVLGGVSHSLASSEIATFDDDIIACGGCVPSAAQKSDRDTAKLEQTIAFASYGLGAAALVTGAYLVYANLEQSYRIDIKEQAVPSSELVLVPTISPDGLGLSASLNF
ncbi:MAG: hypothetical protein GY811_22840 [Myxococcales bacterium]|nr:hypothetical protein [Myxococcales bacterium]